MSNGNPKNVYRSRTGKMVNSPLFLGALIVGVAFMLIVAGWSVFSLFGGGGDAAAPGTGQAAGGNPPPQVVATQEKRSFLPIKELVAAEKLDTPRKVADFMRKNFRNETTDASRTVNEFLVYGGGMGNSYDFFWFFQDALTIQSCKWNVRTYLFVVANNSGGPRGFDPADPIVFFTDSGSNYYFVAQYPNFPIYPMGQDTNPIPYEEKRLGRTILRDYGYLETQVEC